MDWTPLRKFVPGNVAANMAADNPACPLNGRDVFRALSPHTGRRLRSCAPSAPRGRRESSPIP